MTEILFAQIPPQDTISFSLKIDSGKLQQHISNDSLPVTDSLDSILQKQATDSELIQKQQKTEMQGSQQDNSINRTPGTLKKNLGGKELLFYGLIFLLITFAFLRSLFSKYFTDLFRLFFRTTLKQRQIREQLMQTTLPSLAFNVFFVIAAALYIDLLLQHFNLMGTENFWLLFLYCMIGLSVVYLLKYISLKLSGWLFNSEEPAESYLFIVFVVNKIMGIFLLPFLVLLSFAEGELYKTALVLSWIGISVLFIYRFILTFAAVHNQIKVNLFHFFLYLCAFEVAPLLLIYKALLFFFR